VFKKDCYFYPIVTSFGMITALLWAVSQRVVAIPYSLFGTTYRSFFKGQRSFCLSRRKPEGTQNWNVSKNYNKPIQCRFSCKFIQLLHADLGRTDRNDDFDGRFSQLLCEGTYKLFSVSQRRCFSITKVSHLMLVLHVFFLSFFLSFCSGDS